MHGITCGGWSFFLGCYFFEHHFRLFHHKHRLLRQAQNATDFFGSSHFDCVAVERASSALFDLFDLFVRQTSASGQIGQGPPQFFATHT